VGRQPWIVYEVMRTKDAVTDASGIWVSLSVVILLYTALGISTVVVLRAMARRWREAEDVDVPYGPRPPAQEPPEAPA
jgi:cytochrome bd ubiquinol oxidase subunit I